MENHGLTKHHYFVQTVTGYFRTRADYYLIIRARKELTKNPVLAYFNIHFMPLRVQRLESITSTSRNHEPKRLEDIAAKCRMIGSYFRRMRRAKNLDSGGVAVQKTLDGHKTTLVLKPCTDIRIRRRT